MESNPLEYNGTHERIPNEFQHKHWRHLFSLWVAAFTTDQLRLDPSDRSEAFSVKTTKQLANNHK